MAIKKYGVNVLGYEGVESSSPPNFTVQKRSPLISDYRNVTIGDIWFDSSMFRISCCPSSAGSAVYMLVSKISKQAQWVNFGGENIDQLTGDTGGPVPTTAGNINVLGTAGRVTTVGNPGANTVTWDIGASIADTYTTDAGSAVSAANILNITGINGITTSGAANSVTISLDTSDFPSTYTTDSGSASPAANNINVLGGTGIDTVGVGDTVTIAIGDDVATQFTTDSGIAVPASSTLELLGDGSSVSTVGASSTITINNIGSGAKSAFFATLSAYLPNFTGNSPSGIQIPYDTVVYDINSDFDITTGEFVAPVDGIYFFLSRVALYPITIFGNKDNVEMLIKSTAALPQFMSDNLDFAVLRNTTASNTIDIQCRGFMSLTAGTHIITKTKVDSADPGASNNVGIDPGGSNVYHTYFQGHLVTAL